MPRHEEVKVTRGAWVQLTNADVASISFQIKAGANVLIAGTIDATEPASAALAWVYGPGQGEGNRLLADLFPGIAAKRVWARIDETDDARVMVSHA